MVAGTVPPSSEPDAAATGTSGEVGGPAAAGPFRTGARQAVGPRVMRHRPARLQVLWTMAEL